MTASRLLVLLALIPLCATCFHSVKLAPEVRAIRVVSVSPTVPVPDELELFDPSLADKGAAGATLAIMQSESRADEMNELTGGTALLADITRSEFESAIAASRLFELDPGRSEAAFHLSVYYAGLRRRIGHSLAPYISSVGYELKPILGMQVSLQDASEKVLWQRREITTGEEAETPEYLYQVYAGEPDKVREAFTAAARVTAAKLVAELRKQLQAR
jgi:hypothetical protein